MQNQNRISAPGALIRNKSELGEKAKLQNNVHRTVKTCVGHYKRVIL